MPKNTEKQVPELTIKQKKFLKKLAHPISPSVQIGKDGLSDGLIESIRTALVHHELIKVKISNNSGLEKKETAQTIPLETDSSLVQLIGKTLILYRPNPKRKKEKRIVLPKA
ncbi:ribosome assembly RNA-binding protein YhbY [Desulfomarina sp.]